ncbi:MAG: hypothetical protein ACFCGT_24265 [Sandaracinaceae bacterium]
MAKKESTIANRVALFDSLAAHLVGGPAGALLVSANGDERQRALRALGDLAYVAHVLADGEDRDARALRALLEGATVDPPAAPEAPPQDEAERTKAKKKSKAK